MSSVEFEKELAELEPAVLCPVCANVVYGTAMSGPEETAKDDVGLSFAELQKKYGEDAAEAVPMQYALRPCWHRVDRFVMNDIIKELWNRKRGGKPKGVANMGTTKLETKITRLSQLVEKHNHCQAVDDDTYRFEVEREFIRIYNDCARISPDSTASLPVIYDFLQQTDNWLKRQPTLYHPSWLYTTHNGAETERYAVAKNRLSNFLLLIEQAYSTTGSIISRSSSPNLAPEEKEEAAAVARDLMFNGPVYALKQTEPVLQRLERSHINYENMMVSWQDMMLIKRLGHDDFPPILFYKIGLYKPMEKDKEAVAKDRAAKQEARRKANKRPTRRLNRKVMKNGRPKSRDPG